MAYFTKNENVFILFATFDDEPEHVWGVYSNAFAANQEFERVQRVCAKPSMNIHVELRVEAFIIENGD